MLVETSEQLGQARLLARETKARGLRDDDSAAEEIHFWSTLELDAMRAPQRFTSRIVRI